MKENNPASIEDLLRDTVIVYKGNRYSGKDAANNIAALIGKGDFFLSFFKCRRHSYTHKRMTISVFGFPDGRELNFDATFERRGIFNWTLVELSNPEELWNIDEEFFFYFFVDRNIQPLAG